MSNGNNFNNSNSLFIVIEVAVYEWRLVVLCLRVSALLYRRIKKLWGNCCDCTHTKLQNKHVHHSKPSYWLTVQNYCENPKLLFLAQTKRSYPAFLFQGAFVVMEARSFGGRVISERKTRLMKGGDKWERIMARDCASFCLDSWEEPWSLMIHYYCPFIIKASSRTMSGV